MKVPSIFKNELVHYGLIFLAVLNIVGYVSARAYECLLLFGVGYYAANTYFKNVGLSILSALFFSNFIFGCGRVRESFLEGMKGAREHMVDAKVSNQKASLELMKGLKARRDSGAFTTRRTLEGFKEAIDETVKVDELIDNAMEGAEEALEKKDEDDKASAAQNQDGGSGDGEEEGEGEGNAAEEAADAREEEAATEEFRNRYRW
jgi:hypothetical protein